MMINYEKEIFVRCVFSFSIIPFYLFLRARKFYRLFTPFCSPHFDAVCLFKKISDAKTLSLDSAHYFGTLQCKGG